MLDSLFKSNNFLEGFSRFSMHTVTSLNNVLSFLLQSLLTFCVHGSISDFTQETPEVKTNIILVCLSVWQVQSILFPDSLAAGVPVVGQDPPIRNTYMRFQNWKITPVLLLLLLLLQQHSHEIRGFKRSRWPRSSHGAEIRGRSQVFVAGLL